MASFVVSNSSVMNDSTRQLCETLLWTECDSEGNPLDKKFSITDFSQSDVNRLKLQFELFVSRASKALAAAYVDDFRESDSISDFCCRPSPGGFDLEHDFIMTRNGHGCGFWDGDWEEPAAKILEQNAKALGEIHVCVNGKKLFMIFP